MREAMEAAEDRDEGADEDEEEEEEDEEEETFEKGEIWVCFNVGLSMDFSGSDADEDEEEEDEEGGWRGGDVWERWVDFVLMGWGWEWKKDRGTGEGEEEDEEEEETFEKGEFGSSDEKSKGED